MEQASTACAIERINRPMSKMSCCPSCWSGDEMAVPLIPTIAFDKYEFYCLECGGQFGFLDPYGIGENGPLNELYAAMYKEWLKLTQGHLIPEHQQSSVTPERLVLHEAAMGRIRDRVGKRVV